MSVKVILRRGGLKPLLPVVSGWYYEGRAREIPEEGRDNRKKAFSQDEVVVNAKDECVGACIH